MPSPTATGHPGDVQPAVPRNFYKGARRTWHQLRRHRSVLRLLRRVHGDVLDYGCGYGDLTYAISATHPVRGVDVDPARVAFAAREYAPIPFSVCRPDGLDFPDRSFDVVTSVVVIHFSPDPIAHLREIHRVLRPDGHVLIVAMNLFYVRNFFRGLLGRRPVPEPFWIRPRNEFRALLEGQGFRAVADDYFYDPPFETWVNPRAAVARLAEQVLSLFRVKKTSNYYMFLARKVSP
jgi:SAM-dependent methyltransferase